MGGAPRSAKALGGQILVSKKAICEFRAHPELHQDLAGSLDFFMQMKKYRDAIIHSTMFHVPAGIGKGSLVKGKRDERLLTETALKGVYDRLTHLRDELTHLLLLVIPLRMHHQVFLTSMSPIQAQYDQHGGALASRLHTGEPETAR